MAYAKDGRLGWIVLGATFIMRLVVMGIVGSGSVTTVALLDEFGESVSATTWVASLCTGVTIGAAPASSFGIRWWGHRITAFIGAVLTVSGLLFSLIAETIAIFYITLGLVFGLGASMVYMPTITILPYYFDKHLSFAYGFMAAGGGLGACIMPLIEQASIDAGGLSTAFIVLGGLSCLVALCSILLKEPPDEGEDHASLLNANDVIQCKKITMESPTIARELTGHATTFKITQPYSEAPVAFDSKTNGAREDHAIGTNSHAETNNVPKSNSDLRDPLVNARQKPNTSTNMISLLNQCNTWAYGIGVFLFKGAAMAYYILAADFSRDAYGSSNTEAALVPTVIGAATLAAEIILTVLGLYNPIRPQWFLCSSSLVLSIVITTSPVMPSFGVYLAANVVFGLCFGTFISLTPNGIHAVFGTERLSEALGIGLFFDGLGIMAISPFIGYVTDVSTYTLSFTVAGGLSFIGCGLISCVVVYDLYPSLRAKCGRFKNLS